MHNATIVNRQVFSAPLGKLFNVHPRPNLTHLQIELKRKDEENKKIKQAERRAALRAQNCKSWATEPVAISKMKANLAKVVADVPVFHSELTSTERKLLEGVAKARQ